MEIILFTLKTVATALIEPTWLIMLVFLAFILYRKNKKTTIMQK